MGKISLQEVLKRFANTHQDKYDYGLVEYKNMNTKVKIKCKKCNYIFEQFIRSHVRGAGCSVCKKQLIIDESEKRFREVHNNFYEYDMSTYKNVHSKMRMICPDHGEFWQTPANHKANHGCYDCGRSRTEKITPFDVILKKSVKIHKDEYEYIQTSYTKMHEKMMIICKKHGIFHQTPIQHIHSEHGCPKCKSSKGEKKIAQYLNENNIEFETEKRFEDCKNTFILPFDFFLTKLNICIEFDGLQHTQPIEYFGGIKRFKDTQINDKIKNEYCKQNNIDLIRIPYIHMKNINKILTNKIRK